MKIAVLILAAGKATRMKKIKQLLPVGSQTLLEIALATAEQTQADQIFCVLGANSDLIRAQIQNSKVKFIDNKDFESGLGSSIKVGVLTLEKQGFEAVLIMLGDQPKITPSYVNALITSFKNEPEFIHASNYIGKNGVPAIFHKNYFPQLVNLQGDTGAGRLLNDTKIPVKTSKLKVDLIDIDTEEDYRNLSQ